MDHPSEHWPSADASGSSGTVDVWRVDLRAPQGEAELLDETERARAARFLVESKRHQFARSRAALRRVLARATGLEASALRFELGPHGRPVLAGAPELDFNLSHSGTQTLIAVASGVAVAPEASLGAPGVGVDVEEERPGRNLDLLARRFFAPDEVDQYASHAAEERVAAFYRAWTRKEAYLKAWGTGLTFSSRRFTIDLCDDAGPGGARLLRATEMPGDDGRGWWFVDLAPRADYRGALCVRGERPLVRRLTLDPEGPLDPDLPEDSR